MRADLPCAVYRLYDEWCTALYYGSSGNVFNRLGAHASRAWHRDVGMVLLDWYPSGEIARAVERGLIMRDQPRHNVVSGDSIAPPPGMPALPSHPVRVIWAPAPVARIGPGPRLQSAPVPDIDADALLRDIREAFGRAPRVSTADLVTSLAGLGWADLTAPGDPAKTLARWLAPLGIKSRSMRIAGLDRVVRGYARYQFAQHWAAMRVDILPSPV